MKKLLTLVLGALLFSAPAFAQAAAATDTKPAFGTVSAVTNTSFSVTVMAKPGRSASTRARSSR